MNCLLIVEIGTVEVLHYTFQYQMSFSLLGSMERIQIENMEKKMFTYMYLQSPNGNLNNF